MSAALIGVAWQGDEEFHVQLTESGLECDYDKTKIDDEGIVTSIREALEGGRTVFVVFEPDEYFASETDSGLVDVKVNGLTVLGIADTDGTIGDLEAEKVGIDGDILFLVLDGDLGIVEYQDFEGEFRADGSVEFTEIEEDEFDDEDEDDDDFDDDDDDDVDDEGVEEVDDDNEEDDEDEGNKE